MNQSFKIMIEGEDARAAAQQLLSDSAIQGQIQEDDAITRAIDWAIVMEIVGHVGSVIGTAGGAVSLAHTLWKWRKELKDDKKVVLSEGKGEAEKRLLLEKDTTEEEIDNFLHN